MSRSSGRSRRGPGYYLEELFPFHCHFVIAVGRPTVRTFQYSASGLSISFQSQGRWIRTPSRWDGLHHREARSQRL